MKTTANNLKAGQMVNTHSGMQVVRQVNQEIDRNLTHYQTGDKLWRTVMGSREVWIAN